MRNPSDSVQRVVLRGTIATVGAVVANAAVLRAGLRVTRLPGPYQRDALGPIVVSAAAAVAATLLYAYLDRHTERTYRTFLGLIGVGLLVSFGPILVATVMLPIDPPGIVVLVALHLVVALVIAAAFIPRTR